MNKKTKVIVIIAGAILIAIIGVLLALLLKKPKVSKEQSLATNLKIDTSAENAQKASSELSNRQVYFAGIGDGAVHKDDAVYLKNPKSNEDIYMRYTIINEATGEEVFATDLIEPANEVAWVPGETLPLGQYDFKFVEEPFYQVEGSDGWMPLTVGNNHVVITIVE